MPQKCIGSEEQLFAYLRQQLQANNRDYYRDILNQVPMKQMHQRNG
ncbi:hypothetical protein DOY81_012836 [Sarcophaga bullata]|nr:hypothetical protein DOY81_012836 [Sarcophaga bullata]